MVGKQTSSVIQSLFTVWENLQLANVLKHVSTHLPVLDKIIINYGHIRGTNKNITYSILTRHVIKPLMVIYNQFIVSCNTIFQFSNTLLIKS